MSFDNRDKDTHENIADLNYNLGNYDIAVNSYLRYVNLDDKNPNVYAQILLVIIPLGLDP